MKKMDIMKRERFNLKLIVLEGLRKLRRGDYEKFLKHYLKTGAKLVSNSLLISEEDTAVEGFLSSIPEYVELVRRIKDYSGKVELTRKDFYETAEYITEIMQRGIRRGLLVDVRRGRFATCPSKQTLTQLQRAYGLSKRTCSKVYPRVRKTHPHAKAASIEEPATR